MSASTKHFPLSPEFTSWAKEKTALATSDEEQARIQELVNYVSQCVDACEGNPFTEFACVLLMSPEESAGELITAFLQRLNALVAPEQSCVDKEVAAK